MIVRKEKRKFHRKCSQTNLRLTVKLNIPKKRFQHRPTRFDYEINNFHNPEQREFSFD